MRHALRCRGCPMLIVGVALVIFAASDCLSADKAQKIGELMDSYHENRGFQGAVLAAENGRVIYKQAFGFASLEWQIPNGTDTRFALASVSKTFTAALALIAVQSGELTLDSKVSQFLPEYPKEKGDRITIRHLLNHTSGIPIGIAPQMDRRDLYQEKQCNKLTRKQYLELISGFELLFEPGTQFQYSNFGYSLLAMALEEAAGKPYPQLLQERICEPLGMTQTCTDYGTEVISKRATRYRYWFLREPELAPLLGQASSIGCGDVYSSVEDLYLWDRALYTDQLISGELRELCFTPVLENNGFGWIIEDYPLGSDGRTVKVVKREGGSEGTRTCMLRLVDDGHLVVILSNYREPYFLRTWLARPMQDIAPDIIAILYGQEVELPKKSAVVEMGLSMRAHGWDKTEETFRREFEKADKAYDFDAEEFHWGAFSLYNDRRPDEALNLFRFTERYIPLDEYDRDWNFHFDFGRAYMSVEDWGSAIAEFEEAIHLNPADPLSAVAYIAYCNGKMKAAGD